MLGAGKRTTKPSVRVRLAEPSPKPPVSGVSKRQPSPGIQEDVFYQQLNIVSRMYSRVREPSKFNVGNDFRLDPMFHSRVSIFLLRICMLN